MAQNEVLVVNGKVTRATYDTLKAYLMPPMAKIIMLAVLVGYDIFLLVEMILQQAWLYGLLIAVYTAFMIIVYRRTQSGAVKRIVASRKELRDGTGIELTLTLSQNGVRMFNNGTGRERNLRWNEFVSMCETERCIALFVKKSSYLILPKENMDEDRHQKVLAMIHAQCPKLKKRW